MKSASIPRLAASTLLVSLVLGLVAGCSKSDDEKLKEDVAAIRAIKEKEQADQQAEEKAHKERVAKAAAAARNWGNASPASSASAPGTKASAGK